jgi:hypothetical protein
MSAVNTLMKFDVTATMKLKRDGQLVDLNVEITLTKCLRKINYDNF